MVRVAASVLVALLLLLPQAGAVESSSRLIVKLTPEAATQARAGDLIPDALSAIGAPDELTVEPLFPEPTDPELRTSWYAHNLDQYFRVAGVPDASSAVAQLPGGDVLSAELDEMHHALALPNDYDIYGMWGLEIMECPEAWDIYQADNPVIVSTIDTGCKIQHEDLADNIYVNPGEDLNGNGVWDESDNNGIDDDNNGYVDDISGWDFVSVNQPWGTPAEGEEYGPRDNMVYPDVHGHGTHVMGTAAAVTNNGIGVAAASWNAVALPLRAGFAWLDGATLAGSGNSSDFMVAIQYAVEQGARVISISFGGPSPQQAYQDVVTFARDNNVLLFASAGNNGDDARNYPAAYDGAVAVAASTPDDYKAGFSTYGDWVGLTAPGTIIWSTMVGENYRPQDYIAWQGTSMASPNAASVATLVLGLMPELTDDQLEMVVKLSCDDIDWNNGSYAGLLGAGRVNARRALEYAPSVTVPTLDTVDIAIDRSNGTVTLSYSVDPGDEDDFLGYNIYRNGDLLVSETMDMMYVDQLPEPGDYEYTVRGVFGDIETLPKSVDIFYSGLYGLPVSDSFEGEVTTTWENLNEEASWPFSSRHYHGEHALGVSAPNSALHGVRRFFEPRAGVVASAWFNLSNPPANGGEGGAIHLLSGDEDFKVFVGPTGSLHLQLPEAEFPMLIDEFGFQPHTWYHLSLHYLEGTLSIFLMDADGMVLINTYTVVDPWMIDGVLFGGKNQANAWSFFDAVSVRDWPDSYDYYQPVSPWTISPYPIVITEGVPGQLDETEIAALDGDLVVGATAPIFPVYPQVLYTYSDPGDGQGFTIGNPMAFEVWDGDTDATTLYAQTIANGDGNFGTGLFTRLTLGTTGVDGDNTVANDGLPREFDISDAYPNPFNPSTTVQVALPKASELTLRVFNVMGREVATLAAGNFPAGRHSFSFDGHGLSSGLYFFHAQVPGQLNELRKVTLMK